MMKKLYAENIERRDKLQIFADIIKVTTKKTKTTRILRLANVQYNTFIECIETLCEAGLLEKIPPKKKPTPPSDMRTKYTYKATDTGIKWSEMVDEIYETLENNQ